MLRASVRKPQILLDFIFKCSVFRDTWKLGMSTCCNGKVSRASSVETVSFLWIHSKVSPSRPRSWLDRELAIVRRRAGTSQVPWKPPAFSQSLTISNHRGPSELDPTSFSLMPVLAWHHPGMGLWEVQFSRKPYRSQKRSAKDVLQAECSPPQPATCLCK